MFQDLEKEKEVIFPPPRPPTPEQPETPAEPAVVEKSSIELNGKWNSMVKPYINNKCFTSTPDMNFMVNWALKTNYPSPSYPCVIDGGISH